MAIEIKELVIKFTITEGRQSQSLSDIRQSIPDDLFKDLVNECTEEVMNKLSRNNER